MQPIFNWTYQPWKDNKAKGLLAIIVILLFSILVLLTFRNLFFGIFALVVLFLSIIRFFIPTTYTLTEETVSVDSIIERKKREWNFFENFTKFKNGYFLNPAKKLVFKTRDGIFLRISSNFEREKLEIFLKKILTEEN